LILFLFFFIAENLVEAVANIISVPFCLLPDFFTMMALLSVDVDHEFLEFLLLRYPEQLLVELIEFFEDGPAPAVGLAAMANLDG
jgi:hypothetical protein